MKHAALRALQLALCAALITGSAGLGFTLGHREAVRARPAMSAVVEAQERDPLAQFRTEREELRARQTAQLNDIIYDATADADTLSLARQQLVRLLDAQSRELRLEGILKNRGFSDVLVDAQGQAVSVLVRTDALTQQQCAVILELVMRETGVTGGNIKIIPVNPVN